MQVGMPFCFAGLKQHPSFISQSLNACLLASPNKGWLFKMHRVLSILLQCTSPHPNQTGNRTGLAVPMKNRGCALKGCHLQGLLRVLGHPAAWHGGTGEPRSAVMPILVHVALSHALVSRDPRSAQ